MTFAGPVPGVLRTPDERFADLPGYAFTPRYVEITDPDLGRLRQHYVEEGPGEGPVVLLTHGEPTWSYLYRHMIPRLAARGYRVIAPDLIGFGKSDKPTDPKIFSYRRHVAWLGAFVDALALRDIHLFCQDWGGLIGLRLVAERPELFKAVIAANTGLPDGRRMSPLVTIWRLFARVTPVLPVGAIVANLTTRTLSRQERQAYDAPFPDEAYKTAARCFPKLIPMTPNDPGAVDNRRALARLKDFNRPFLTLFGADDPVATGTWDLLLQNAVGGAKGQPHAVIARAAHMLQEDVPDELCQRLDSFFRAADQQ